MNNFERFNDKEDSKEKKKKAGDKRPLIFESANEDKKPEKRGNVFETKKPEKSAEKESDKTDLEKLSDDEKKTVIENFVEARADDLKQELTEVDPDSVEEAAVLADAAFIEAVNDRLDADAPIDDEALDALLDETLEELEIEPASVASQEATEPSTDTSEGDEDNQATKADVTSSSTTLPPTRALPHVPPGPVPPPPRGPTPPAVSPGPAPLGLPNIQNLNAAPQTVINERYYTRRRSADLLVGGIVGYLIGRRRGRIETEDKLLPIQKNLESEVKNLHEKIAIREDKIRKLVVNKIESQPGEQKPQVIERLTETIEQKIAGRTEAKTEPKIEAGARHVEKLAAVLLPKPETPTTERVEEIGQLTMPELLEIGAKVKIEGVSLKTMYESGRLDAVGLRRVVQEYQRSGNYERLFTDVILSNESPEKLSGLPGNKDDGGIMAGGAAGQPIGYANTTGNSMPKPLDSTILAAEAPQQQSGSTSKKGQTVVGAAAATIIILILLWLLMA